MTESNNEFEKSLEEEMQKRESSLYDNKIDDSENTNTIDTENSSVVNVTDSGVRYINRISEQQQISRMDNDPYHDLSTNVLPSKGLFYPIDFRIKIRPAYTSEIVHFSALDETNQMDVENRLNFILEKCVKISVSGKSVSYRDIVEIDRLSILFHIRDLTFDKKETNLTVDVKCTKCPNVDVVSLDRNHFNMIKIDDFFMSYYNSEKRAFEISLKNGETFMWYMPTIGMKTIIMNLYAKKQEENPNQDFTYLTTCAPFDFSDYRQFNEAVYNQKKIEQLNWSKKKISAHTRLRDRLFNSINPNLEHSCSACGEEVSAPIIFRGGIKSFFIEDDADIFA